MSTPEQRLSASQTDDAEKKAAMLPRRNPLPPRRRHKEGTHASQPHPLLPRSQTQVARGLTSLAILPIRAHGSFADAPRQQRPRDDKAPKREDSNPPRIQAELPPIIQDAGLICGSSTDLPRPLPRESSANWDVMTTSHARTDNGCTHPDSSYPRFLADRPTNRITDH